MAADRYFRSEEFLTLYLRYRLDDLIAYESRRAERSRRRQTLSQLLLIGSLMLVVVSYVLGNVDHGLVKIWVVTGVLFAAVSLALGVGMIAFGLSRQADIHGRAARSLDQMRTRKPGGLATTADVEQWVRQVEAIISSAGSDVEVAPGQLPRPMLQADQRLS